jgi:hypothetical protein
MKTPIGFVYQVLALNPITVLLCDLSERKAPAKTNLVARLVNGIPKGSNEILWKQVRMPSGTPYFFFTSISSANA